MRTDLDWCLSDAIVRIKELRARTTDSFEIHTLDIIDEEVSLVRSALAVAEALVRAEASAKSSPTLAKTIQ